MMDLTLISRAPVSIQKISCHLSAPLLLLLFYLHAPFVSFFFFSNTYIRASSIGAPQQSQGLLGRVAVSVLQFGPRRVPGKHTFGIFIF